MDLSFMHEPLNNKNIHRTSQALIILWVYIRKN
jgi:hypothetical protein